MEEAAMAGVQKEVRLEHGVIRYRESGEGEPILFVHGLLANGLLWRKLTPHLAQNYRCIVPDWPLGSHQLPFAPEADLTPPGIAAIIAEFMAALDLTGVTLVGNDTGGAICQLVITRHPDRIKWLVLTNCDAYENFLPLPLRPFQWVARLPGAVSLMARLLKRDALAKGVLKLVAKKPVELHIQRAYFRPAITSPAIQRDLAKVLRGISNRYTLVAAAQFPQFRQPVLLAWASEDRFFPVRYAEKLRQDFPDSRLELIGDSYIFIPEDQPQQLAEVMEAFMRSTAGASLIPKI